MRLCENELNTFLYKSEGANKTLDQMYVNGEEVIKEDSEISSLINWVDQLGPLLMWKQNREGTDELLASKATSFQIY